DLVHDPGLRRDDAEVLERVLAPPQEDVPLPIPPVLELGVRLERVTRAELVHLDRVVDHQLHRLERIDPPRIAAQRGHRVTHRRPAHHRPPARAALAPPPHPPAPTPARSP